MNDEKYIINGEPNEILNDPNENILSGGDETDGHTDNKNITKTLIEFHDEPEYIEEVSK